MVANSLVGSALIPLGFVHATGLPTYINGKFHSIISARPQHLGKYDSNNGLTVVVTPNGEVWLQGPGGDEVEILLKDRGLKDLAPKGRGAFVPCSNGEQIPGNLVLWRTANPESDCSGAYPAFPMVVWEKLDSGGYDGCLKVSATRSPEPVS